MKKTLFITLALFIYNGFNGLRAQDTTLVGHPLYDSTRVYDTVTDGDDYYLFPPFKPCIMPWRYDWAPHNVLVQEYVATDTVTVYGVAITLDNPIHPDHPFDHNDTVYGPNF